MAKNYDISRLKEIAKNARIDVIKMLEAAKGGHLNWLEQISHSSPLHLS